MRISDWSSDVCSSDLLNNREDHKVVEGICRVEQLVWRQADLDQAGFNALLCLGIECLIDSTQPSEVMIDEARTCESIIETPCLTGPQRLATAVTDRCIHFRFHVPVLIPFGASRTLKRDRKSTRLNSSH